MAKIVREDKDQLNTTISLTLQKGDYEPKFKSELNKYQREAHMKGFRKGKTPMSFIKKMYGKSLFAEVMNNALQKNLFDYIEAENIKYIGQPLGAEGHTAPEIDYRNIGDYEFKFDLGLFPAFELQGADSSQVMERLALEAVSEEKLSEQIDRIRKERGSQESVDEPIEEMDMLVLDAKELDGDELKDGGVENEFRLLINENIHEAAKTALLGKNKGDSVRLNIFELEENMDSNMVRKYYLGLETEDVAAEEEEGDGMNKEFELTIVDVLRLMPAEKTEEFFQSISGGEFSTEEEAKEFLENDLKGYYENQMNALLNIELRGKLLEQNEFDMPDAFLKRWLQEANNYTPEQLEKDYDDNIRADLRWSVIVQKLVETSGVSVEESEVITAIKQQIKSNYGLMGMEDSMLDNMVYTLLEKYPKQYEQMYQEILNRKVFDYLREQVTIEDTPAAIEELDKRLEDFQAEQEAKQKAALEAAAEEE